MVPTVAPLPGTPNVSLVPTAVHVPRSHCATKHPCLFVCPSIRPSQFPEEHDLESQIRKEREWRFLRNSRVRKQAQQLVQRGEAGVKGEGRSEGPGGQEGLRDTSKAML